MGKFHPQAKNMVGFHYRCRLISYLTVFLSFTRNIGTPEAKVAKNMSSRYSQKLVDRAKISATDAIKTTSKRAIQKTAQATRDLVGNKIADKITRASKKSHNEEIQSNEFNNEIRKERYISPKERQQIIEELRLI